MTSDEVFIEGSSWSGEIRTTATSKSAASQNFCKMLSWKMDSILGTTTCFLEGSFPIRIMPFSSGIMTWAMFKMWRSVCVRFAWNRSHVQPNATNSTVCGRKSDKNTRIQQHGSINQTYTRNEWTSYDKPVHGFECASMVSLSWNLGFPWKIVDFLRIVKKSFFGF